jgi:hypothetical protein
MTSPIATLRIENTWQGEALQVRDQFKVRLARTPLGLEIVVEAPFYGDPPPPVGPMGPVDGLWEHEVVEIFVSGPGAQYTEIELSPTGHHLVIQLDGVRRPVARLLDIAFEAVVDGSSWRGEAQIPAALLPDGAWRFNVTAIHGSGLARQYSSWVKLPGDVPDFHQPSCFRAVF